MNQNSEIVKVGIIGYSGSHAQQSHIGWLEEDPTCHITAVADIHTDMTDQQLIESPDVDAVFVMTPDRFHTHQLVAAVEQGKHVLVEKPLADTWSDYELLRNGLIAAREKRLIVSTCHPRRFDPPFVNTKKLLNNRGLLASTFGLHPHTDLGQVVAFSLGLNYSRPSRTGIHSSFASDHLPHEADTASHFFGMSGLRRAVSHVNEDLEFDVEAEREDGIKLRFTGNRLQEEKGWREDWHVRFASGAVLSVDAHTGTVSLAHEGTVRQLTPRDKDGKPLFKTDYETRFRDLNNHFIRSVRGEETPYLTHNEMLLNTVLALALQDVEKPVAISVDGTVTPAN